MEFAIHSSLKVLPYIYKAPKAVILAFMQLSTSSLVSHSSKKGDIKFVLDNRSSKK